MAVPATPTPGEEILDELSARRAEDVDWRRGRVFSLVYHPPGEAGEAHERLLARAHALYAGANLLNPMAFKGLRRLESEVVEMAAELLSAPAEAVGCVTSGGTESILLAVKAMRDRARSERPWVRAPELVVPSTVHPAFDKAAHYFGVRLVKTEVGADLRADAQAMADRIGRRTIGLVVSAPQYPHGVLDPVAEVGAIAQRKGLPLHVDACVGGFLLPWIERLGRALPLWDFRAPGVTSMSADLHKYGYAGKGASVLLWRDMALMRHQFFVAPSFPGGVYASPTILGTRPGGPIAAAWAALRGLGEAGYRELTLAALQAAERLRAGIAALPGFSILGAPPATILAWTAPDVYAVADRMEARGWAIDRQHRPACIHLTCTANHLAVVGDYLDDLRAADGEVRRDPRLKRTGTAPMYGMIGGVPLRGLVASGVRRVLEELYGGPAPNGLMARLLGGVR